LAPGLQFLLVVALVSGPGGRAGPAQLPPAGMRSWVRRRDFILNARWRAVEHLMT
jgi:hypothetical protein